MNEINKIIEMDNNYNTEELNQIINLIDECKELIDLCNIKYELLFKINKWLRI
jgi:hypothetical protein